MKIFLRIKTLWISWFTCCFSHDNFCHVSRTSSTFLLTLQQTSGRVQRPATPWPPSRQVTSSETVILLWRSYIFCQQDFNEILYADNVDSNAGFWGRCRNYSEKAEVSSGKNFLQQLIMVFFKSTQKRKWTNVAKEVQTRTLSKLPNTLSLIKYVPGIVQGLARISAKKSGVLAKNQDAIRVRAARKERLRCDSA